MGFFDSKLITDIERTGELPTVPVAIEKKSIIDLGVALTTVAVIVILLVVSASYFKKGCACGVK